MRFLSLFLLPCMMQAQDTIYLRNNISEAAKVLEVSSEAIRYKRSNNLEGPDFVRPTSEIDSIRFRNGLTERFDPSLIAKVNGPEEFQYLSYRENLLFYKQRPLNDGQLKMLIQTYPDLAKRKPLLKEFEKMKKYRSRQYVWGIAGPIIGGYTFLIMTSVALSQPTVPVQYFAIGAAVGGGFLLVSLNQSKTNKQKRLLQKQKIAGIYNRLQ